MGKINYVQGDATYPIGEGPKIIAHICNDKGAWGLGFVMALSKQWSKPKSEYQKFIAKYYKNNTDPLGQIQLVQVKKDLWIANMIAQHGFRQLNAKPPIRYDALESCLMKLSWQSPSHAESIHMPRIGAGLAGGDWKIIEPLIEKTICQTELAVYVYDLF